jgi:hypothetical protein
MPESGPYGSVRGVSGNGHLYRDQHHQRKVCTWTRQRGIDNYSLKIA